jgi:hypothetical protein
MTTRAISVHLRRGFFRFFYGRLVVAGMEMIADDVSNGVSSGGHGNSGNYGPANLTGGDIHTEAGRMRKALVEGRFRIPEA